VDRYDAAVLACRPALTAVLAAVALGGCGTSSGSTTADFKGEQRAVAQVVEDLQDAGRRGDAQRMCDDLLAKPVVARLTASGASEKRSCADTLDESLKDADTFDLEVTKVTVTGGQAQATVRSDAGKKDRTDTIALVKEGRNWKLSEIR
jgi:ketosteroid isomerase-like protein